MSVDDIAYIRLVNRDESEECLNNTVTKNVSGNMHIPDKNDRYNSQGKVIGRTLELRRSPLTSEWVDRMLNSLGAIILKAEGRFRLRTRSIQKVAPTYSCIFNLVNGVVGAGLLAFPYAYAKMGLIIGISITLLASLGTIFSLYLLSVQSIKQENPTFSKLAVLTMPKYKMLVDFVFALMCFGNALGYILLIGDNAPDAISGIYPEAEGLVVNRRFWIVMVVGLICFPVCLLENLHNIRHISFVGVILTLLMTVIVCLYAFVHTPYFEVEMGCKDGPWYIGIPPNVEAWDIIREIPVFLFAFGCHQNILTLCNEAKTQTQAEFNRIIVYGIVWALIIYILFASVGFYLIGIGLEADIVTCLPRTSVLVNVCRFAISFKMAFSVPLQLHPSRNGIVSIIYGSSVQAHDLPGYSYYSMTFILVAAVTGIALVVTEIHLVFSLIGSLCEVIICYILPGFFFVKLVKRSDAPKTFAMSRVIILVGVLAVPLFIVLQIT